MFCLLKVAGSPRFPAIPPSDGPGWPKQWRLVSRSIKPRRGSSASAQAGECARPVSCSAALCAPTHPDSNLPPNMQYAGGRTFSLYFTFQNVVYMTPRVKTTPNQVKAGSCFIPVTHCSIAWKLNHLRAQSQFSTKNYSSLTVMQLL